MQRFTPRRICARSSSSTVPIVRILSLRPEVRRDDGTSEEALAWRTDNSSAHAQQRGGARGGVPQHPQHRSRTFALHHHHDGMLPRTIEQLVPDYLPKNPATSPLWRSPFGDGSTGSSYEFLTPGAKLADLKPETANLRGKFKSPAGRHSVYLAVQNAQLISD